MYFRYVDTRQAIDRDSDILDGRALRGKQIRLISRLTSLKKGGYEAMTDREEPLGRPPVLAATTGAYRSDL